MKTLLKRIFRGFADEQDKKFVIKEGETLALGLLIHPGDELAARAFREDARAGVDAWNRIFQDEDPDISPLP